MQPLLANPFVRHLVWRSLILPGLTTLTAGLILVAVSRRTPDRLGGGLWALPLLAGLLAGYFAVYQNWSAWPHSVLGWLPALALATLLLAGIGSRWPAFGQVAVALLAAGASAAMLQPMLRQASAFTALRDWASVALLWWLLWAGASGGHSDQRDTVAAQVVLAGGLAAIGPLSQSMLLGQLAMLLGASLVVVLALSCLCRSPLAAPSADLGALVLGILYVELWYYAAAPWRIVLALLIAAALGGTARRLYRHRAATPRLPDLLIPAASAGLPTLVGVYLAWQAYSAGSGGY